MRRFRTSSTPWCVVAVLLLLIAVFVIKGSARDLVVFAAFIVFLVACIRAVALETRDDDVSSSTIRSPGGRVLGMMGAQSANARRRRRLDRERRGD